MKHRTALLAVLTGTALLGAACSDHIPSAPISSAASIATGAASNRDKDEDLPGERRGWSHGSGQAALVWCESHPQVQVSGEIGAPGGTIVVGNARLIIPAGAITKTVHFTATQPGGHNAMVSFEPSGLQFKKPAGLQFDVSGCDVSNYTPDVVYLNDEGVIVERIEATYSNYWHQVAAPIKHFSSYALAW